MKTTLLEVAVGDPV